MHPPLPGKISICGKRELDQFADAGVTHILAIEDPEVVKMVPPWFQGEYCRIQFHDFTDKTEDSSAVLASKKHVKDILRFGNDAFTQSPAPHLLVHCAAGISRSPAAAFVILAQAMGPGQATAAMKEIRAVRPECFPNALIVQHADALLSLNGELIRALSQVQEPFHHLTGETPAAGSTPGIA